MEFDFESVKFSTPEKRIFDSQGTIDFQKSVAMIRIQYHLHKYITLCKGQSVPDTVDENMFTNIIVTLLDRLCKLIDETPAERTHSRYGNLSYRDWQTKFESHLSVWLNELLPEEYHRSIIEISYYISNAFGSKERIDYGTGHELSFLAVIISLDLLNIETIRGRELLYCFNSYYNVIQKLILTYKLEPAGSHGVWGLDDHFHFAYILGATQLLDSNTSLLPKDVSNSRLMEQNSAKYLFCKSISFINAVKTGPFANHSPLLYNISRSVHTWNKMQQGLIKMYKVEVLNKFPVVQHFWFGTAFFPWTNYDDNHSLPIYQPAENTDDNDVSPAINITTKMPPPLSTNTSRFIHRR
ncbi:unnamed protein product [Kluyveromyces dobzhanskii CBS 2104]|uniref:Serine/threonine-protein phosphatase 2A activator n=1 Tax=Kluyveromyces dobzhanskii CBS 2104 TaxID=1427455 RepID=A0A0A8L0C1_9SACH|nr:unnamed protein product [Kluyveromyces dobzhanskii CBS 2104]